MSNIAIDLAQRLTAFTDAPSRSKVDRLSMLMETYRDDLNTALECIDDLTAELETYNDDDTDREGRAEARDNAVGYAADLLSAIDELS